MKIKASDKRYAAIKEFGEKWRPESNGYKLLPIATAELLTADIEAMRPLGRTDRWQNVLGTWQAMINEYPDDFNHVDWAALQGSVYAAYAAD